MNALLIMSLTILYNNGVFIGQLGLPWEVGTPLDAHYTYSYYKVTFGGYFHA